MTHEVEAETIGSQAGNTPFFAQRLIANGITNLVHAAGSNSAAKGFHDDWPVDIDLVNPGKDRDLQRAIVEKLALIHEEISEALGEIRSGHTATDVYYSNVIKLAPVFDALTTEEHRTWKEQDWEPIDDALPNDGSRPVLKPEGFGVELADAVIRIADLAYLTGVDLGSLVLEKMTYNATRPHKHGRKF